MGDRLRSTNRFAIIPEWVLYGAVGDRAVRVYGILARHANSDGENAFPGRARIAQLCGGVSTKSVDRALAELREIGAVTWERRHTDGTLCEAATIKECPRRHEVEHASNLYTVHAFPFDTPPEAMDTGVPTSPEGGMDTGVSRGMDTGVSTPTDSDVPTLETPVSHEREPGNDTPVTTSMSDPAGAGSDPAEGSDSTTSKARDKAAAIQRENPDACRLVLVMRHGLEALGVKVPAKGTKAAAEWVITMDQLLRLGAPGGQPQPVPADEVERVIRFCLQDEFEQANVHSPGALRRRWDQLRLKARRANGTAQPRTARVSDFSAQASGRIRL